MMAKVESVNEKFVGEGERACLSILKSLFGKNCEYKTQYPFAKLMKGDFADSLSDRQQKQTLDIVIFRNGDTDSIGKKPTIVVRVQDKHHKGILTASRDLVQKQMLEWNECVVVDLWWEECPELWEENVNEKSIEEVSVYLRKSNLL